MLDVHCWLVYMCPMNWGAFDLNLLIVFDAVMQERSVTRAGNRIGLSQPAMSHALKRLRHMLKDESPSRRASPRASGPPSPSCPPARSPPRHRLGSVANDVFTHNE